MDSWKAMTVLYGGGQEDTHTKRKSSDTIPVNRAGEKYSDEQNERAVQKSTNLHLQCNHRYLCQFCMQFIKNEDIDIKL